MFDTHTIQQVKALQQSGKKFTIIECGNGAAVANTIMMMPGAAQMLYQSIQPYSRESQTVLIGPYKRSVSLDWTLQCLQQVTDRPLLITQFQLQGNDPKILTHGWIACASIFGTAIYHISFLPNNSATEYNDEYDAIIARENQFRFIADAAIQIMYKHTRNPKHVLKDLYIDGVFDGDGNIDMHSTLEILSESTKDTFVVVDNGWKRMEDLMRETKGLIIMRGSFNPMHIGHLKMLESAKAQYPDYKAVCLISLHNRDKAPVSPTDAIMRASEIEKLGYTTIFSSLPFFKDSSATIRLRWNHPIIYPVGMDTINRFIDDVIEVELSFNDVIKEAKYEYSRLFLQAKTLEEKRAILAKPESVTIDEAVEKAMKTPSFFYFNKSNWKDVKFLIFEREGHVAHRYDKYFTEIIQYEKTYKDNGVSSTKIRNGEW